MYSWEPNCISSTEISLADMINYTYLDVRTVEAAWDLIEPVAVSVDSLTLETTELRELVAVANANIDELNRIVTELREASAIEHNSGSNAGTDCTTGFKIDIFVTEIDVCLDTTIFIVGLTVILLVSFAAIRCVWKPMVRCCGTCCRKSTYAAAATTSILNGANAQVAEPSYNDLGCIFTATPQDYHFVVQASCYRGPYTPYLGTCPLSMTSSVEPASYELSYYHRECGCLSGVENAIAYSYCDAQLLLPGLEPIIFGTIDFRWITELSDGQTASHASDALTEINPEHGKFPAVVTMYGDPTRTVALSSLYTGDVVYVDFVYPGLDIISVTSVEFCTLKEIPRCWYASILFEQSSASRAIASFYYLPPYGVVKNGDIIELRVRGIIENLEWEPANLARRVLSDTPAENAYGSSKVSTSSKTGMESAFTSLSQGSRSALLWSGLVSFLALGAAVLWMFWIKRSVATSLVVMLWATMFVATFVADLAGSGIIVEFLVIAWLVLGTTAALATLSRYLWAAKKTSNYSLVSIAMEAIEDPQATLTRVRAAAAFGESLMKSTPYVSSAQKEPAST